MTKKKKNKLTPQQAKLVEQYIGLAHNIVNKHRHWDDVAKLSREDLDSEAYLGLVQAAMNWNESIGPFLPYAKKTIKNVLIEADRQHSVPFNLPWNEHRILRDIRRTVNDGTPSNPTDVAKALKINVSKIVALWPFYDLRLHASVETNDFLDEKPKWDKPRKAGFDDVVIEDNAESPEDQVTKTVMAEQVQAALACLPPTHRQIIRYRFGFETGEPMLSSEIMEVMGLGRAEYQAAEDAAMEKVEAILRGHKGSRTENE